MLPTKSLIITDLDNTLFDWVGIWHASFSALLECLVAKTGLPRENLLDDIKIVHQQHGTSEYAFLIEEIKSLKVAYPNQDLVKVFDECIYAHRKARKAALELYPTVRETLRMLKQKGCLIASYTESMAFYTNYRIRNLNLDGLLDFIYSPADHDLPKNLSPEQIRLFGEDHYKLVHAKHRYTPPGETKPNPDILRKILADVGANAEDAVYIGDSLMKDVAMAQTVGVADVHAAYGESKDRPEYPLLRRVTHWTTEDVERERNLTKRDIAPSYSLRDFGEILSLFDFKKFESQR